MSSKVGLWGGVGDATIRPSRRQSTCLLIKESSCAKKKKKKRKANTALITLSWLLWSEQRQHLINLRQSVARLTEESKILRSCIPDKDIRVFYLDRRFFSCIPDKDIRVFHQYLQILSQPCYLTQDRIKITCI